MGALGPSASEESQSRFLVGTLSSLRSLLPGSTAPQG